MKVGFYEIVAVGRFGPTTTIPFDSVGPRGLPASQISQCSCSRSGLAVTDPPAVFSFPGPV